MCVAKPYAFRKYSLAQNRWTDSETEVRTDVRRRGGASSPRFCPLSSNRGPNTDLTDRIASGSAPARRARAPAPADRARGAGREDERDRAANDEDSSGRLVWGEIVLGYTLTHRAVRGSFPSIACHARTVLWSAVQPERVHAMHESFSCSSSAWSACKLALRPSSTKFHSATPQHNHVSCK